jgi:hypothetical protein
MFHEYLKTIAIPVHLFFLQRWNRVQTCRCSRSTFGAHPGLTLRAADKTPPAQTGIRDAFIICLFFNWQRNRTRVQGLKLLLRRLRASRLRCRRSSVGTMRNLSASLISLSRWRALPNLEDLALGSLGLCGGECMIHTLVNVPGRRGLTWRFNVSAACVRDAPHVSLDTLREPAWNCFMSRPNVE